jgi:hypothetical protein
VISKVDEALREKVQELRLRGYHYCANIMKNNAPETTIWRVYLPSFPCSSTGKLAEGLVPWTTGAYGGPRSTCW